jgi:(+)-trans-carveol dehydrogenase
MGRLDGIVAFITGAARGQGRSHAIRMAEEGADVLLVDICEQIETVPYELGTWEELEETAAEVERRGRKVVVRKADVRDEAALAEAVAAGLEGLGRLDVVVANAGIWSGAPFLELSEESYNDAIDVLLHGAVKTCRAAVPAMLEQDEGGSIVLISSTAGLAGYSGQVHYNIAKHGLVGLMRSLANELAPASIRVNSIHPGATLTPMIDNESMWRAFAPGKEAPTMEDCGDSFRSLSLLPTRWAESIDVSHAVVYLAADESRFVTGVTLPIDTGFMAKAA